MAHSPEHGWSYASKSPRKQELPANWSAIRLRILRRDRSRCQRCGRPGNQVDHIRRGNDHSDGNLQTLCVPCHRKKTSAEAALAQHRKAKRPVERHPGLTA